MHTDKIISVRAFKKNPNKKPRQCYSPYPASLLLYILRCFILRFAIFDANKMKGILEFLLILHVRNILLLESEVP